MHVRVELVQHDPSSTVLDPNQLLQVAESEAALVKRLIDRKTEVLVGALVSAQRASDAVIVS